MIIICNITRYRTTMALTICVCIIRHKNNNNNKNNNNRYDPITDGGGGRVGTRRGRLINTIITKRARVCVCVLKTSDNSAFLCVCVCVIFSFC